MGRRIRQAVRRPSKQRSRRDLHTLYLMRECIKSTGVTGNNVKRGPVKLRDCWAGLKDAEAPLTGATSMDKNGDGTRIPTVLEVKDGKFTVVQ